MSLQASGTFHQKGSASTNAGKKEQRQFNQILDKAVKEGREGAKDVEARTVPKQHRLRGRKSK
jgi:hypothetical protein